MNTVDQKAFARIPRFRSAAGVTHEARWVAGFVLLLHAGLLAWGSAQQSPTWDEPGHLVAGLSHWQFGRLDLYRVNPPLVRMVASAPLTFVEANVDWTRYDPTPGRRSEQVICGEFMRANGESVFRLFFWARWACVPFSLLGGIVCFVWARRLYGPLAGLLALGLWCFDPNVIAHGQLMTPDVGAASLGVAAAYLFWRWLREPGWSPALAAGYVLGLAELAKATWIILFVLWPALWLVYRWPERRAMRPRAWSAEGGQLGVILLLAVCLINTGYGFEGSFQRLGDYGFVSQTLGGPSEDPSRGDVRNRFAGTWLGGLPVPLPKNYLMGIDQQKLDFERGLWAYLDGEWGLHAWWYYYLYALAIKVPLGTWLLLLLALVLSCFAHKYPAPRRDELVLLAPLVTILVLVSSQTGVHYLRYALPIFPFAFIWISKLARAVDFKHKKLVALVALALGWSIVSSLSVYPHSLSYFNELVGGPTGGHWHLLDSNIDWGQDLLYFKRWYENHPEARPMGVAYWNSYDARVAGIECVDPPPRPAGIGGPRAPEAMGPLPGWYALSVNELHRRDRRYDYSPRFEPVAMAGYSIYIYHISLDEANRVRRELGLPELPGPE